ncbi:hypothetical protein LTA6_000660 [Microbacterium sp. LTA6]|uniref:hypothetical protein n=1 Tax=unclassified Microbacterium TaxID=2609290 RepID=UPI00313948CD
MDEVQTMVRTQVAVNGGSFFLAQGQNVDELKGLIEEAVRTGGRFVDFTVMGNRVVSVLISAGSQVVISVETVQFDTDDDGDDAFPFGGMFDLL